MRKKQLDVPVKLDAWREDKDAFEALIARAQENDRTVLPILQQVLTERPHIWQAYGNLAKQIRTVVIESTTSGNLLTVEARRRYLDALREQLAGPNPSPLESLLAERVCLRAVHLGQAEGLYALAQRDDCTIARKEFCQRRFDRTQNQYLKAIRALAQIRRLELPAVQVNIAEQQINTMGTMPLSDSSSALR